MLKIPIFLSKPNRSKSFSQGATVVLLRDYTQALHIFTGKFSQNEICVVAECGLSEYLKDERTKRFQQIEGGPEWCQIELCDGTEDPPQSCCVKAEDLREFTDAEYDQRARNVIFEQTGRYLP